jgi:hypothetical protein
MILCFNEEQENFLFMKNFNLYLTLEADKTIFEIFNTKAAGGAKLAEVSIEGALDRAKLTDLFLAMDNLGTILSRENKIPVTPAP